MHPGSSHRGDETGKGTPPPNPGPSAPSPSPAHSPPLPASPNASASHVIKPLTSTLGSDFTFDNRITMTICGETIPVDLHTLDSNPTAIIALLTAANTERGNWITVGCFYRRRQNPQAAIAVISALLEVLRQHGADEVDLKPAYLLLSGSEMDIAKRDPATSAERFGNAKRWLQMVYGCDSPSGEVPPSANSLGVDSRVIAPFATPAGGHVATGKLLGSLMSALEKPRDAHVPNSHQDRNSFPISNDATATAEDLCSLEREMQSLRDKHGAQSSLLSQAHSAKRKLENELTNERLLRRKLEERVNAMEKEVEVSRKMEKQALQQFKAEVGARRKAEGRVESERERRKDVERRLQARSTKPLFENLAAIFQQAASGEAVAFDGLNYVARETLEHAP